MNEMGITVSLTDRGRFKILDTRLAWTFMGRVGACLTDFTLNRGSDRAGSYQELVFTFRNSDDKARQGKIRLYEQRSVILFELAFVESGLAGEAFPSFTSYPRKLHHLAYKGSFGGFSFRRFGSDGPWIFFSDDNKTFILSPASHFLNSALRHGPRGWLRSEVICSDEEIPPGFTHATVLALADGINRAFDIWGHFLTDRSGKGRPSNDADVGLKYLGYWTNRGARYYYGFEAELGCVGTLLKVRDAFHKAKIGLGYMQIDSWFYPKGREGQWRCNEPLGGGIYLYEASKELFPDGFGAFQQELGLPLVTHGRWIDQNSPYRGKYAISGNVPIDPALWSDWMGYLSRSGVQTYEQDWLSGPAQPERSLEAGERFMDLMAQAAETEGMTMQYCMPFPRHFLQGSKYAHLTTIRTSGDRLGRETWKPFLFNGRLATALGEWPFTDVFMSSEMDNLLFATLSGSMVGVGDAIGAFDWASLLYAVRRDGVIVKPDDALTPLDQSYLAQTKDRSAPVIAVAHTDHHGWITSYVLAFGGGGEDRPLSLSLAELGYVGSAYAYDYFQTSGLYLDREKRLPVAIFGPVAYWLVVPVRGSGIGFLGDRDKFVSNGRQRISAITDDGVLRARVVLAEGEDRIRLHGFAVSRPDFKARHGEIENMAYESRSGLFQCDLIAEAGEVSEIAASCSKLASI